MFGQTHVLDGVVALDGRATAVRCELLPQGIIREEALQGTAQLDRIALRHEQPR